MDAKGANHGRGLGGGWGRRGGLVPRGPWSGEELDQGGDGEADGGDADQGALEGRREVGFGAEGAVEDGADGGDADRVADLLGGREDAGGGAGVALLHRPDHGRDQG